MAIETPEVAALNAAVDKATEKLKLAQIAYEQLQELDLPTSIKQASDEGWELAFDALNLGFKLHYSKEDRERDRTRVIPVKRVLAIIAEFEEKLVTSQVSDPPQLLWAKVRGIATAIRLFVQNAFLLAYFDPLDIPKVVITFLIASAAYLWTSLEFAVFVKAVKPVFVDRDGLEKKLRSAALPQAVGKRYRRRRSSRK